MNISKTCCKNNIRNELVKICGFSSYITEELFQQFNKTEHFFLD